MRRAFVTFLVGCAASCSSTYRGVEAVEGADLRVVVTYSAEGSSLRAIAANVPYERTLGSLLDDSEFEVWIFPYTLATLTATFPLLAGASTEEVLALLNPKFDASGEDTGYAPPPAMPVLHAILNHDSDTTIQYQRQTWDEWLEKSGTADRPRFSFHIKPDFACPGAGRAFRVFDPDEPANACVGIRSDVCAWRLVSCAYVEAICPALANSTAAELPTGGLALGASTCANEAVGHAVPCTDCGVSERWHCAAGICGASARKIAIQDTQIIESGGTSSTWSALLTTHSLGGPGFMTTDSRGADAAVAEGQDSRTYYLKRLQLEPPSDDYLTPKPVKYRKPEGGAQAQARTTTFGEILRLSGDAQSLVMHGENHTHLYRRPDPSRTMYETRTVFAHGSGARTFAGEPLRGEIVSSRLGGKSKLYAAVKGGIVAMDQEDQDVPDSYDVTNGGPVFSATVAIHHVTVAIADQREWIIVCPYDSAQTSSMVCSGSMLHVFDTDAAYVRRYEIPGEILAILDGTQGGPRVVFRRHGRPFDFWICAFAGGECMKNQRRYVVPPLGDAGDSSLVLPRDGFLRVIGDAPQEMLAFTYGDAVGLIDLATGHSTIKTAAFQEGARAIAIFPNTSGRSAWIAIDDGGLLLHGFPILGR